MATKNEKNSKSIRTKVYETKTIVDEAIVKAASKIVPEKYRHVFPNILTTLRLAAIPAFLVTFGTGMIWTPIIIAGIAELTDYFDGALARGWKVQSKYGKTVDPIADKGLIISVLTAYAFKYNILMLAPVIGEAVTSIVNANLFSTYGKMETTDVGKEKNFILMFSSILALISPIINSRGYDWVISALASLNLYPQSKAIREYYKIYKNPPIDYQLNKVYDEEEYIDLNLEEKQKLLKSQHYLENKNIPYINRKLTELSEIKQTIKPTISEQISYLIGEKEFFEKYKYEKKVKPNQEQDTNNTGKSSSHIKKLT